MAELRSAAGSIASVAWAAARSFFVSFALVMLLGLVLACISGVFLGRHHWLYGVIGVVVALFEAGATAFVFSTKRAVATAAAHGCGTLGLGRTMTRLLFDRIFGIAKGPSHGERGSTLAQGIERLPLAQAETMLMQAVHGVTGEAGSGGWLRGKIQSKLLDMISRVTMTRFREQNAQHGGVDLLRVQEQLEQSIDESLVRTLRGGIRVWTAGVLIGLPFVVAAQTFVVLMWLRYH